MEENRVKVQWVTRDRDMVANALGYATHNRAMMKHTAPFIDLDDNADIALTITPADIFEPVPGKFNILFCMAPETKVLKSDLTWVPVGDIKIGDELIGFDEKLGMQNKFRRSQVTGTSRFIGKSYRVRTTQGDLVCSGNHMWVAKTDRGGKPGTRSWIRTDNLRVGDRIVKWKDVWQTNESREAGWLAGFLDGEGWISNSGNGNAFGFAQNEGKTLDYACSLLDKFGVSYNKTKMNNRNYPESTGIGVQIHKGLGVLGSIRPTRLLDKAHLLWEGTRTWNHKMPPEGEVLSVECIGESELIGTKTTTGTLIAEGFLSHNTMWEFPDVPQSYIDGLNKADMIVVPSKFCRDIFRPHTKKPIEVCWEGVDPHLYRFHERKFPDPAKGEKFRILWIGAPNPRKGYYTVLELVELVEKNMPMVEVYMKTTSNKKPALKDFARLNALRIKSLIVNGTDDTWRANAKKVLEAMGASFKHYLMPEVSDKIQRLGKHKNIVFDTRKLPMDDLIALYNSAHCFVMPHCGEGWCLPLSEAMATGCPCVATDATGSKDFFDAGVGYPVKTGMGEAEIKDTGKKTRVFIPDTADFLNQIKTIIHEYDSALLKGKMASVRIHSKFTWQESGKRLGTIIKRAYENIHA